MGCVEWIFQFSIITNIGVVIICMVRVSTVFDHPLYSHHAAVHTGRGCVDLLPNELHCCCYCATQGRRSDTGFSLSSSPSVIPTATRCWSSS
mmetsp:Transcript_43050/g.77391  ORF Transcript_43050/g.77391 Transcript_43050/m.77391 type:complete len:92 (-) Transcript_43050:747-1022(-)